MKSTTLLAVVKTASPLVLGALGGFIAVSYPSAHAAFCAAGVL